jgi:two-component system phosphate regulon response regulator PhoB
MFQKSMKRGRWPMVPSVLVIEDKSDLVRLLEYNFSKAGYRVLTAKCGEEGLASAQKHTPDVVLLDVMMPGLDGWEVCRRLRQESSTSNLPLIMLTARAEEADRVLGLELGADDYITKPFGVRELLVRVNTLLRRSALGSAEAEVLKLGKVVIDSARRVVLVAGKEVPFTATEFNLLRVLAERKGLVISREELMTLARGNEVAVLDRTIDVHLMAVRRKLGKFGALIETVRGIGYRWQDRA